MKCAVCGKEAVMDGLCAECYTKKNRIAVLPEKIKIIQCPKCGRIFLKNRWLKMDFYEAVESAILNALRVNDAYSEIKIDVSVKDIKTAEVVVSGELGGKKCMENYKVRIAIEKKLCNVCAGNYEAILQLRGTNEKVEEMQNYVETHLKENVRITKIKAVKTGVDIYLNSRRFANSVSRALNKAFGGIIGINKKLYSVNHLTSKKVYRTSILFRAFPFSPGDVIKSGRQIFLVKSFGKGIKVINLKTGKKDEIKFSDRLQVMKKEKTVVARRKPRVEVIHPESFQAVSVSNPALAKKLKEECYVVVDNGYVYIIP